MTNDEFYKKLSEVCDWHLEEILIESGDSTSADVQVVIDKIHREPCPYGAKPLVTPSGRSRDLGCQFTIRKAKYCGQHVWVKRCISCGGLIAKDGTYIEAIIDPHGQAKAVLVADGRRDAKGKIKTLNGV